MAVGNEPTVRGGIDGYPTGLTWDQHHLAARVVASASTDAVDCAELLAALGIHPADGLPAPATEEGAGPDQDDPVHSVRRKRNNRRLWG